MKARTEAAAGSIAALVFAAAALALPGCRSETISAARLEGELSIDGARADWEPVAGYDFEKEDLYLGAAYDDTFLYLLLATSDRALSMEAFRRGLRLRFRPEGEEMPVLWLGSPGSVRATEVPLNGPPGGEPVTIPGEERDFGRNTDERLERALADLRDEVRVFTAAGEDSVDLTTADATRLGIEMRPGYEKGGRFILEVKLPLLRDERHPLAIGARPSPEEAIELNLAIPKREYPGGGFSDAPPGMGGRGFPGGPGGGMGGGMGPPRRMSQGLDIDLRIVLARESAAGS